VKIFDAVVNAAHTGGAIVKVILETALLDDKQKTIACTLAKIAGAELSLKTSTGFGPHGATAHDVALMRQAVGPVDGVKASGGIRTLEDLKSMVAAGRDANRCERQREDYGGCLGRGFRCAGTGRHCAVLMATAAQIRRVS